MPCSRAARDERVEVLDRAEVGVDRGVPALGAADRPRAARGRRASARGRVVAALARGLADRVDRREVEDVDAERGELRQARAHARRSRPTSAGRARTRRRRARAAARRRARRPRCARASRALGAARRRRGERRVERRAAALGDLARSVGERGGRRRDQRRVGAAARARAVAARIAAPSSSSELELGLAGGELALELVAPGREAVDERLDLPLPASDARQTSKAPAKRSTPSAGSTRASGCGLPAPLAGAAVAHARAQHVVAVEEDRRGDLDGVALARLRAIAAAVDHRLGVLDLDPRRALARERDAPVLALRRRGVRHPHG